MRAPIPAFDAEVRRLGSGEGGLLLGQTIPALPVGRDAAGTIWLDVHSLPQRFAGRSPQQQVRLSPHPTAARPLRFTCMLHDKFIFEPLRELSRKQILDKDWLLSNMFRRALSL